MTDADAFLAAVIADPDADGPRLAYADWLDERGDADRAEFIRVQCAVAKVDENNRDIHPLAAREQKLLKRHRDEWVPPLQEIVYPRTRRWFGRRYPRAEVTAVFRRGFPEAVLIPAERFFERGAELCRAAPIREIELDCLHVPDEAGCLAELAQCPYLERLSALRLVRAVLPIGEFGRLAHSPYLTRLRELYVDAVEVTGDDVIALAESPLLARLHKLKLYGFGDVRVDTPALTSLVESSACRGLVSLGLCGGMVMCDEHLLTVVTAPHLENLTELDLFENLIWHHLATALPQFRPRLRRLSLRQTLLDDVDAAALSQWPGARSLLSLNLSRNRITGVGALDLADSPYLLAPTRIDLTENPISRRVKRALQIRFGDRLKI